MKPDLTKGFECYVDADWAGNWSQGQAHDTASVLSRSGYIITYAGCPILWGSKMQSLVALSTTEAEYIALSTALREVINLMNLLEELKGRDFPLPFDKPNIRCKTFEDNQACLTIATEPKMRPRTKHLAVRFHHFRQHVKDGKINIEYVDTKNQVADIFTKPLPREAFRHLRLKMMGW